MQIAQALEAIAQVGSIRLDGETIKVSIDPWNLSRVEAAIDVLRRHKPEALEMLKMTVPACHALGGGALAQSHATPVGENIDRAMNVMNVAGTRIIPGPCVAVPAGRLTGEVLAAVRELGMANLPLVTLPELFREDGA